MYVNLFWNCSTNLLNEEIRTSFLVLSRKYIFYKKYIIITNTYDICKKGSFVQME